MTGWSMEDLLLIAIPSVLSSSVVGGIVALVAKSIWSPESKNELTRLGNEFAQQLLNEARSERKQLRETINDLQEVVNRKRGQIEELEKMARSKDRVIKQLEHRRAKIATLIQEGAKITMNDIFGKDIPEDFTEDWV